MVVPLFGWSAGDIVTSINILCAIASAFKEATGAKSQYTETVTWLETFVSDLEIMHEYTTTHATAKYTQNIVRQIEEINKHYVEFETYLQKFDKGLSSNAKPYAIGGMVKKVKWTFKELKGKVNALKAAVTAPLVSVNLLLAFESRFHLKSIADAVAELSMTPTPSQVLEALDGLDLDIKRLQAFQVQSTIDVSTELKAVTDKLENGFSESRDRVASSLHSDIFTSISSSGIATEEAIKDAVAEIKSYLQRLEDSEAHTQFMHSVLRKQLGKIDLLEELVAKTDHLTIAMGIVQQHVSSSPSSPKQVSFLEVAQTAGTAAGLILGLINMSLISVRAASICRLQKGDVAKTDASFGNRSWGSDSTSSMRLRPDPFQDAWRRATQDSKKRNAPTTYQSKSAVKDNMAKASTEVIDDLKAKVVMSDESEKALSHLPKVKAKESWLISSHRIE